MIGRRRYIKLLKKNGNKVLSIHCYRADEYGKNYPLNETLKNSSYLKKLQ
jgi:hypothetical protein